MKSKKIIWSLSTSSLLFVSPIFITSCNQSQNNEKQLNDLKNKLNNLIESKKDLFNNDSVSLVTNVLPNTQETFFNIFSNNYSLIDVYFKFDKEKEFQLDGYQTSFSFFYNNKDSFGEILKPFVSKNKTSITIPVLVTLTNTKTWIQVSKYMNLFTLSIKDYQVNDLEDKGYNGTLGKAVVFENVNNKEVKFRSVPKEMVDKYLSFILLLQSKNNDYEKSPIYYNKNGHFAEWKGKTLSEVKGLTESIKEPGNYYDGLGNVYKYSIKNSFFYEKERQFANFVITISLDYSQNPKILTDAKEFYNLDYSHDYSIINRSWSFALPSESDISTYVSENSKLLDELNEKIKDTIYINTPIVVIDEIYARNIGVKKIVEKSKKELHNIFQPPKSFMNVFQNGQEREISFEVTSLEEVENETDVLKINMNICIGQNDLKSTKEYSKKFNIRRWEFV